MVTALQAPEWCLLLKRLAYSSINYERLASCSNGLTDNRVGDSILLHLLTDTSVYVPLPNDCYCQIIGPPLIYSTPPESLKVDRSKSDRNEGVAQGPNSARKRKRGDEDTEDSERPNKRRRKGLRLSRSTRVKDSIATHIAKKWVTDSRQKAAAKAGSFQLFC